MPSVFKDINQQKNRRTLGKTSPLAPSLLTYSVGRNHPLPIKKKIRIIKKVFGTVVEEDGEKTKILL